MIWPCAHISNQSQHFGARSREIMQKNVCCWPSETSFSVTYCALCPGKLRRARIMNGGSRQLYWLWTLAVSNYLPIARKCFLPRHDLVEYTTNCPDVHFSGEDGIVFKEFRRAITCCSPRDGTDINSVCGTFRRETEICNLPESRTFRPQYRAISYYFRVPYYSRVPNLGVIRSNYE